MLRNLENLCGCAIAARDGDVGIVDEAYFDDDEWGVRYLVINAGNRIHRKKVLISPHSIKRWDPGSGVVHVELTRQQIRDSPDIDTDKPVSRQREAEYLGYYGYPTYWGGSYLWGVSAYPAFSSLLSRQDNAVEVRTAPEPEVETPRVDTHLRSSKEIRGYYIEAADGGIGHVSGFVFDDSAWVIRYLTIDTRNWWPGGKEVLLATQWIELVNWVGSTVSTTLTRDAVKNSPVADDAVPLSRHFEAILHKHYGKAGYWSKEGASMEVFERVGTREFSAKLELDAGVILREGNRELTCVTLNSALPALAERKDGPAILESTIAELLRALIREYARVV